MTSDVTSRWALPMLFAGQAQKELFHNEALGRIDLLLHGQGESADIATPPSSPAPGACWIVPAGAGGAWLDQEGCVAGWTDGGWRFVAPRAGLRLMVADRGHALEHDGTAWRDSAVRIDGIYIAGDRVVGPRHAPIATPGGGGTVDAEARTAIAALLDAMRAHGLIGM
ncbi:DUF2793 domain-containing protein [Sphingobium sp. AP49]|uniref:DUF2793 domain-containing protein n=1 Tax=Sphingobium sp. AP49 TaxID=1144307 RepID=UPI00026EDB14|nr:DUF2793 domain-containing protein [Sphingobium sp. AP49]WHO41121.1 DUF2793 domain-containing protein [Sphingobium sp. AP49]